MTPTFYTVKLSTATAAAYETSENTTEDWASGKITREELPGLVAEWDDLRGFEWTGALTAAAEGLEGYDDETGSEIWVPLFFELITA